MARRTVPETIPRLYGYGQVSLADVPMNEWKMNGVCMCLEVNGGVAAFACASVTEGVSGWLAGWHLPWLRMGYVRTTSTWKWK